MAQSTLLSEVGMDEAVRKYMAEIGRRGGKKSRRSLSSEQARELHQKRIEKMRRQAEENPDQRPPSQRRLGPHCLSCDKFDRKALNCTATDCPYDK